MLNVLTTVQSHANTYILFFVCACRCVCVCKNSETKYPFAWLLTNKKRNNVERTDENDQRVLAAAAAAAARKAEFVAAAKRTPCRTALNRGAPRGPA